MSHATSNFGIVTERTLNRVTIFDTSTLTVLHQVPVGVDAIDVSITPNCRRAVVSSVESRTIVELNLETEPPQIKSSSKVGNPLADIDLAPDGQLAVAGALGGFNGLISYSLPTNSGVDTKNVNVQAVAVSPNGSGLVLATDFWSKTLKVFFINGSGNLTMGPTLATGGNPLSVTFTPKGDYAFVGSDAPSEIRVYNTTNHNNIFQTDSIASPVPQTIVTSCDGRRIFVLSSSSVQIFDFDPNTGSLIFAGLFLHDLPITLYQGVTQMAIDPTGTRLFISSTSNPLFPGELAVFSTSGTRLGIVPCVSANGGIAICRHNQPARGILLFV